MQPIESTRLLEALKWRYAAKKIDSSKTIPASHWEALEDALVLSPSSFGLQPWKFVTVTDAATKQAFVPVSWGQTQIAEASHVVVFTVRHPLDAADVRAHIARTAEVRGVPPESLKAFEDIVLGFVGRPPEEFDIRAWCARQVYIAMGTFMTAAALLGIDTCPMEGIDPAAYDRILGLEGSGYQTLAACPAGYRHPDDKYATLPKVRFPKNRVIQTHNAA